MLESLFGTQVIEKILFFLLINKKCYPSQLRMVFGNPLYSFQRGLARLEKGGVVINYKEGKTVVYQLNPRYPFLQELEAFLQRAYTFFPEQIRETYYEPLVRKRPRRQGKPL